MNYIVPTLLCDFYKISHRKQYPENTQIVYATWTPRTSRINNINEVVMFGLQGFIKEYLIEYFNEYFFNRNIEEIKEEYIRVIKHCLCEDKVDTTHIEELHSIGFLPLQIQSLNEGESVPIKVPMISINNTIDKFYWLTNYIETLLSCSLWQPITSATLSKEYLKILTKYAIETVGHTKDVPYQAHDFSMRGMSSIQSSSTSGAGHLIAFKGTDTIPAILYLEKYYNADIEKETVGISIPSTEHSVMCAYGEKKELETYRHLLEDVYPEGNLAIVSDTWDLWNVITTILPSLKEKIFNRNGKIIIRPDSGDPIKILCGDSNGETIEERKGVIELLWDIFGGTITKKGYKLLDNHIGTIYGDAITIERCKLICENLKKKGFASTNVIFGIGSYTYQFNTRDTFGFALKTTYALIDGKENFLFKNPRTDKQSIKKSQKGLIRVFRNNENKLVYSDGLTSNCTELFYNELKPVFRNGKLLKDMKLKDIRENIIKSL